MQAGKEKASNAAASAKVGLEKTEASLQEKAERMTTRDPLRKELATERKDEKKTEAEMEKQRAREYNAAQRQAGATGGHPIGLTDVAPGVHRATPDTVGTEGTQTGEPGSGGIFSTTGYRVTEPGHGTGGT